MATKSDDTFRKVSYAVLVLGIAIGVAGVVMLIIGLSNNGKSSPTCPSNGYPTGDQLNPFFVDASSSNVAWDPSLSDQTSPTWTIAAKKLTTEICSAFPGSDCGHSARNRESGRDATTTNRLVKVVINKITQGPGNGVNYYSTLIFVGDATSSAPNSSNVQNSLNNAGIPSSASGSPTDECTGLVTPPTLPPTTPPPGTGSTVSAPPTTMTANSSPSTTQGLPTTPSTTPGQPTVSSTTQGLPTTPCTTPGLPITTTASPGICYPTPQQLSPFFVDGVSTKVAWDPSLNDPSSSAFAAAQTEIISEIYTIFPGADPGALLTTTNHLVKVTINTITQRMGFGVNYYAMLVFVGDGVGNAQNASNVQNAFNNAGIPAQASSNPTFECQTLNTPPILKTSNAPPSTTPGIPTTTANPGTTSTASPATCYPKPQQLSPFYVDAVSTKVTWDPTMNDPTSAAFAAAQTEIISEIYVVFPGADPNALLTTTNHLVKVTVNTITQRAGMGVNYYATLVFVGDGVGIPQNATNVQNAFTSAGIPAQASSNPTFECQTLNTPPTLRTTNAPPSTTPGMPTTTANPTASPGTCYPKPQQLNSFYVDAVSTKVTWDPTMNDPTSAAFAAAQTEIISEVYTVFPGADPNALTTTTNHLVKVTVNTITQRIGMGVNYYATLVFVGDGVGNPQNSTNVQNAFNNAGIPAQASSNPTFECSGLNTPPTLRTTNASPSTTPGMPTSTANPTASPGTCYPKPQQLNSFYVDAVSTKVTWDPTMNDPTSAAFAAAQTEIISEIYTFFPGADPNALVTTTNHLVKVTVNTITQRAGLGVNYYATLAFVGDGVGNPQNASNVQNAFNNAGIPAQASANPTFECSGLNTPPTLRTTNALPSTTPGIPTTTANPATCYPNRQQLNPIFVDAASNKVAWDPSLNDPTSAAFAAAQTEIISEIYTVFPGADPGALLTTTNHLVKVTVNTITQRMGFGVNYYATLVFVGDGVGNPQNASNVQNAFNSAGIPAQASSNPTFECSGLNTPPTLRTTNAPPSTTPGMPTTTANPTASPGTCYPKPQQLNSFYVDAVSTKVTWDPSLNDPTSSAFAAAQTEIISEVYAVFPGADPNLLLTTTNHLVKVTVNTITQRIGLGVNYYATLAFVGDGVGNPQNATNVQNAFTSAGIPAQASSSPTFECSGLNTPPTLRTTNAPPTTTPGMPTTTANPGICYPRPQQLSPFYVDAVSTKIAWDPAMNDPSSSAFAAAQIEIISEVYNVFPGADPGALLTTTNHLVKVTVNTITQRVGMGVNYYATLLFVGDGVGNPQNDSNVQNAFNNAGIPAQASSNPTFECQTLNTPPTLRTTNAPPSTSPGMPTTTANPTASPGTCYPKPQQLSPFFVDAVSTKVTWDPALNDPTSSAFAAAQTEIISEVYAVFPGADPNALLTTTNHLVKVIVNTITQRAGLGVNYYATLAFVGDGVGNPQNATNVQNAFTIAGIPAQASANPTFECQTLNTPPTLRTTNAPPSTSPGMPTTTANPTASPGTCYPKPQQLNSFYVDAVSTKVAWDPTLNDPTSPAFAAAQTEIISEVYIVFPGADPNGLLTTTNHLVKVTVNTITQRAGLGVNYYATLAFVGDGVGNPQNASNVQNAFTSAGIPAQASANPTFECQTLNTPPTLRTTNAPPTTQPGSGRPPYTNCDPTTLPYGAYVVFLVDTANPTEYGVTVQMKSDAIQRYLLSVLPQGLVGDSLGSLQMGVAVYFGTTAYMVNNFMCKTVSCWQQTVTKVRVNNYNSTSHNISTALLFAYDEFSSTQGGQIPYSNSRLAVVITDGYQYNSGSTTTETQLATVLKNSGFKLTAIVATSSTSVQASIAQLVSVPWSDSFPLNSLTQLTDPTLLAYSANWVCAALPQTTVIPTTTATATLPMLTTQMPSSTPAQEPYCSQYMDIIIILHMGPDQVTFQSLRNFVTTFMLISFGGVEAGDPNDRLTRIAVITYESNQARIIFPFRLYNTIQQYTDSINQIQYNIGAGLAPHLLSEALSEAELLLFESARTYASRPIFILADELSGSDAPASANGFRQLVGLGAAIYGVGIGPTLDFSTFTNSSIGFLSSQAFLANQMSSTNHLRDNACALTAPQATTPPPNNNCMAAQQPNVPPPSNNIVPAAAWPDITILLDTSADLSAGNTALNDRGFEAVRMLLIRTLKQYKIGPKYTRVSLVTFDAGAYVVFKFNDYTNWKQLYNAISKQWEYGPNGLHSKQRNLNSALQSLITNVYNEVTTGFNPNKLNFLWVFTTGLPTDGGYSATLGQIQMMGIRTQAIGLGPQTAGYLSHFDYNSFDVVDPYDPMTGIASAANPLPLTLYQMSTSQQTPPPTLAQVVADVVIAVDDSAYLEKWDFNNVQSFLGMFFTHMNIDPLGSAIGLITYNDKVQSGWTLKQGNSQDFVQSAVAAMRYPAYNTTTVDLGAVLGASSNLTPLANVMMIDLSGNGAPGYCVAVTNNNANCFSVQGAGGLLNWVNKNVSVPENPMTAFLQQFTSAQETWTASHPIPLPLIAADFIMAIDESQLSTGDFNSIIAYLNGLVGMFTIGPMYAQFGVIVYSSQIPPNYGFTLNAYQNFGDLTNAINNLQYSSNDDGTTLSDIADVFYIIAQTMLTPAQGWRMGPTYVIVLSSANNAWPYNSSYVNGAISAVNSVAYTYGIDLVAGAGGFLPQYVQAVGRVSMPIALTINSDVNKHMLSTIDQQYKNSRYPPPTDLSHVYADFVFVIDQSFAMSNLNFAAVKAFLIKFVAKLTTISSFNSQVGIVSYNSVGVIAGSSFHLTDYLNLPDLTAAITNLTHANSFDAAADVQDTLTYLNNYQITPGQGHRLSAPLFVTFIAVAQNLTSYMDPTGTQIPMLNKAASVFGFDYNNYDETYNYLVALANNNPKQVQRISSFDGAGAQAFTAFVQQVWQKWAATNT